MLTGLYSHTCFTSTELTSSRSLGQTKHPIMHLFPPLGANDSSDDACRSEPEHESLWISLSGGGHRHNPRLCNTRLLIPNRVIPAPRQIMFHMTRQKKVKFKTYNEKNLCDLFSRNVTGTEEYFILITASNVMTDFYVKHVKVYWSY